MSRVVHLGFIPPQLPSLVDQPPGGQGWIHEVKHDGFRTMLVIDRKRVRAFTRNGFDWTERYRGIVAAAGGLRCRTAILDGEVIVQDKRGASDFEALQEALGSRRAPLIFYAFDLLHYDGKDLRDRPLTERRSLLKKLLGDNPSSVLQFSDEFVGDAEALFRACAKHELEGIVSKLRSSPYRSGRSKTWLKTKCFIESDLILLGIDRDRKTGAPRALLAKMERDKLVYAGPAFIALDRNSRQELEAKLAAFAQERPAISWLRNRNARWVRPELPVKVKHLIGGGCSDMPPCERLLLRSIARGKAAEMAGRKAEMLDLLRQIAEDLHWLRIRAERQDYERGRASEELEKKKQEARTLAQESLRRSTE
jgi:DNA ligase D-like protein (predicted ligase)